MIKYVPIVKATSAELTAIDRLDDSVKDYITPLFEVGKSRKTTKLPEGDINRCFEQINSKFKDRDFILDITSHPDLGNSQVQKLFDESDGYKNWCNFIRERNSKHIFPVVQVVADSEIGLTEVTKQVKSLLQFSKKVVLRLPVMEPEISNILRAVKDGIATSDQLLIIFDAGFLPISLVDNTAKEILKELNSLQKELASHQVALAASSFPKAVNAAGYGGDNEGEFDIKEINLFEKIAAADLNLDLIYSDYGSIHPIRYIVRGGAWVPRVDMPLVSEIYYYRCRNTNIGAGYVEAASKVISDKRYKSVGSWGNQQIELAAAGKPPGRSPSYWIGVRANIHITTQADRIQQELIW